MTGHPRLFVSIANYRDSETPHTVQDLLAQALRPERVVVGVLSQVMPGVDEDCLASGGAQVKQACTLASASFGACWARSQILTTLREDEDYVLQIDSHSRFEYGWDERLLKMLARCPSPRALLSTYPLAYTPPRELAPSGISVLTAHRFNRKGVLRPMAKVSRARWSAPRPNAFLGANFLFGPACAFDEVPYDPYLYFLGEEISLAVRYWTHGWDIYCPDEPVMYHDYGRRGGERPRHWVDNRIALGLDRKSMIRLRHLLGIQVSTDTFALVDIAQYGLGQARTLAAYQQYADVDFQTRYIGPVARSGHFSAHPS